MSRTQQRITRSCGHKVTGWVSNDEIARAAAVARMEAAPCRDCALVRMSDNPLDYPPPRHPENNVDLGGAPCIDCDCLFPRPLWALRVWQVCEPCYNARIDDLVREVIE